MGGPCMAENGGCSRHGGSGIFILMLNFFFLGGVFFFGYENKTPSNDFLLVTFLYLSSFLVRKIDQLFIARYEKRTWSFWLITGSRHYLIFVPKQTKINAAPWVETRPILRQWTSVNSVHRELARFHGGKKKKRPDTFHEILIPGSPRPHKEWFLVRFPTTNGQSLVFGFPG